MKKMATRVRVSPSSIHRIIHEDLNNKTMKKTKVHVLTQKHKLNRKTNMRKLYENHLAGPRSEYVEKIGRAVANSK